MSGLLLCITYWYYSVVNESVAVQKDFFIQVKNPLLHRKWGILHSQSQEQYVFGICRRNRMIYSMTLPCVSVYTPGCIHPPKPYDMYDFEIYITIIYTSIYSCQVGEIILRIFCCVCYKQTHFTSPIIKWSATPCKTVVQVL